MISRGLLGVRVTGNPHATFPFDKPVKLPEYVKSLVPKRYKTIFVNSRKMQSLEFTGKCIRKCLDFGSKNQDGLRN
jgi:hypothetical protein